MRHGQRPIGSRIRQDILKEKRAEYGKEIVVTLSRQLTVEYGKGLSRRNLLNYDQIC